MAIQMRFQVTSGGSWTDVDITESGVRNMHIRSSDSAPRTATFEMGGDQASNPIPSGSFIQIWDDTGDWEGTAFSNSYPCFEGFCRSSPGRTSLTTQYTAYDPTGKASSDVDAMDEGYTSSTAIDTTAVPRTTYNVLNDRDSDWAVCKANPFSGQSGINGLTADLTGTVKFFLSEIIADILNEAVLPLEYYYAAPGSSATPYVPADLDVTPLQWIPQDKVVVQNASVRQAISMLLSNYAPAYKMQFRAGDRKWRFYNPNSGTQRTYTLNDWDADDVVLSCWLDKTVEGRYTAVELYGPKNSGVTEFSTSGGTLTTTGSDFQGYIDGLTPNYLPYAWQITSTDDQPGMRVLPQYTWVPVPIYMFGQATPSGGGMSWVTQYVATRSPTLQASWDGGTSFITIANPHWNFRTGEVSLGQGNYLYIYSDANAGTDQTHYPPDVVKIVYAPFTAPLSVRYPTSGYSGTAYDAENVRATYRQYHEMLAVGYETNFYYQTAGSGQPVIGTYVTTTERTNQYKKLAEALHSQRCNMAWSGGIVLDGLKWDLLNLNRRVNIYGQDSSGSAKTTGWEAINAIVTDVDYNIPEQTTTVMFNTNLLEVMGYSAELLMHQLNIKALERRVEVRSSFQYSYVHNKNSWRNAGFWNISGVNVDNVISYVDPQTAPPPAPFIYTAGVDYETWGGPMLGDMRMPMLNGIGGYGGMQWGGMGWDTMQMAQPMRYF